MSSLTVKVVVDEEEFISTKQTPAPAGESIKINHIIRWSSPLRINGAYTELYEYPGARQAQTDGNGRNRDKKNKINETENARRTIGMYGGSVGEVGVNLHVGTFCKWSFHAQ